MGKTHPCRKCGAPIPLARTICVDCIREAVAITTRRRKYGYPVKREK